MYPFNCLLFFIMRKVQKDNFEQDICIWIIVIEFLNSEK